MFLVRFAPTLAVMVAACPLAAAPGAELFTNGIVRRLRLEISVADAAALRRDARTYVRATVREGEAVLRDVGLHLKGSTGSFRGLDDKPGFTLNFGKFALAQTFHGLRKIHLNNSVEDGSYLNERLGEELFRRATVPAPRVGHALVELNGRALGLYVLKEGFTGDFLGLHFRQTQGNLYDTGAGRDVNQALEKDAGAGLDDRSDLQALAAAALEPDLTRRWERLAQTLDVERFVSFMAMEVLAAHRDGYCLARNNFRLYHDPETDRFVFLPHGMDQLFGPAELPLHPQMPGLVARAVMETPEGRRRYRERLAALFTNEFQATALTQRVDEWTAQLRPALGRSEAKELERETARLKGRILARAASVARQLAEPEPVPLSFEDGVARPAGWRAVDAPEGGRLEQERSPDGRAALGFHAGPVTAASWRARMLLAAGRYRFEAVVRADGVQSLPFGKNHGAGLRVSGAKAGRTRRLTGDAPWTKLELEFEIAPATADIELICELRASAGAAWFELETLRLIRLP